MRILIAEDERDLNQIITERLKKEHYSVDSCFDGEEALDYLAAAPYDAVILDIMMPKLDGLSVLRKMRNKNENTPVLLLTAKDSVEDRVKGLDAGANDYLVKPFAFEELLARVRVLVRKTAAVQKTCYEVDGLEVHVDTHQVLRNGKEIALSSKDLHCLDIWYRVKESCFPEKNWSNIFGIMIIWAALTWWLYISGICARRLMKDLNQN